MIYKTSVLLSKTKKQYKSRALLPDRCRCCSDFCALVRTFPDTSKSTSCLLLNDEKTALALTSRRCKVATSRRHDVETSRRCRLLTCIVVDPTSRRWDVTTWGRHDVGTSRRASHPYAHCLMLLQNCFQKLPFLHQLHLHRHQSPNQVSSHKNYEIKYKIKAKTKDRRGYNLSVLGTHHTPKLSFLLVPKQELTLNLTHTLCTKV